MTAGAGLALEAVGCEQSVEGKGGVAGELASLEDVKGLEHPAFDAVERQPPRFVEEWDVEPNAVESAQAGGGVED